MRNFSKGFESKICFRARKVTGPLDKRAPAGPEIFYWCHRGYTSVTYTKASKVHFRQLLPSAYYDEFRLIIVQTEFVLDQSSI